MEEVEVGVAAAEKHHPAVAAMADIPEVGCLQGGVVATCQEETAEILQMVEAAGEALQGVIESLTEPQNGLE